MPCAHTKPPAHGDDVSNCQSDHGVENLSAIVRSHLLTANVMQRYVMRCPKWVRTVVCLNVMINSDVYSSLLWPQSLACARVRERAGAGMHD